MFPYAHTVCHSRGLKFDAQGEETGFDLRRCITISKQAGFQGVYSAEFGGGGDPYEGIQKILDLLAKVL